MRRTLYALLTTMLTLAIAGGCGGEDTNFDPIAVCGDRTDCSGVCVDLNTDPANCGMCGSACPAGQLCDGSGTCALSCQSGLTDCGGTCVDLNTDPANCGTCGSACPAGQLCDGSGTCALSCQSGLTDCSGTCIDVSNDTNNCGMCGNACPAGNVCDGMGQCALSCQSGLTDCSGKCIDVNTDPGNCGMCGNACPAGNACDGMGQCVLSCQAGLSNCSGTCTNLKTDAANCGMCGDACPTGNICDGMGQCALSCQAGLSNCSGTCTNLKTDTANCGMCGNACPAGNVCDGMGQCALSCQSGLTDCGGKCTDLSSDDANCGMCGNPCADGFSCESGSCVLSCQAGLVNCGGTCIDPNSNPSHCGASGDCMGANAGTACSMNEACVGGTCYPVIVQSSCKTLKQGGQNNSGVYTINPSGNDSYSAYCDMVTDGGGWTLIARFSNADAKNWMLDSAEWWYTKVTTSGNVTSTSVNADMIAKGFWDVKGADFRFTRTDSNNNATIGRTTANCLNDVTFRTKVTSFGNYQNGKWGKNKVGGSCDATYAANASNTKGFAFVGCNNGDFANDKIHFWSTWSSGDGAVIMFGGGGSNCGRADHGIGITEANDPGFDDEGTGEADFGDEANNQGPDPGYALNLWVR